MIVSTKGRYALRVMIELVNRREEGLVSLREVAREQEISEKYLELIMKELVKGGLVVGLRGKGGGYRLAGDPEACTVAAILKAAEGSLAPVACTGTEGLRCSRRARCAALPMWQELDRLIDSFFQGITLQKLADQARALEGQE